MSEASPVIHWFRRDLRLTDNTALIQALQTEQRVITVFVFDPAILNSANMSAARIAFMLEGLAALRNAIHKAGGRLLFYRGKPEQIIPQLVDETGATAIYCNHDYTPYSGERDQTVQDALNVPLKGYHDAVIMAPGTVMTNNGDPYTVYTPFKKKWRKLSQKSDYAYETDLPGELYQIHNIDAHDLPTLDELDLEKPHNIPEANEDAAQNRLSVFLDTAIYSYAEGRNELALHPFNGVAGTSQLSPYFRMGLLSPRQAMSNTRNAFKRANGNSQKESVTTWVDELIWREFYMHIMAHYPHVYRGNFRDQYDYLEWEHNPEALTAWKNGETGYPIVDAAMRQLKAVGWMPNRARMIVASFLTKDLFIHWQEGERHFMQHLLDGDPAANNGGWQWAAGTGTDAQPYFRIFNPTTQGERYDPHGDYIREWIPELADLDDKTIHNPQTAKQPPKDYPTPIVNHKEARARTLDAFKRAREVAEKT